MLFQYFYIKEQILLEWAMEYTHLYTNIKWLTTNTSGADSVNLSLRNSRSNTVSVSESEWRSGSIIVQNPLQVIFDGIEVESNFSVLEEEDSEYEECVFRDEVSENIVEVNMTATDNWLLSLSA